jgi:hypothetical protein
MRLALLALIIVVLAAGCVTPSQKLGCCLKANMSQGCVLYNVSATSAEPRDLTSNTTTIPCSNTTGCNVTVAGNNYLIPICTEDDLAGCTSPECTAMVCGDFAYKPRVSPGIGSIGELEGDVPPNLEEEAVAFQFYKAQCRFIPMDADLRQIMKTSKSQINVFRLGVGGSFDEFDQYRYFFPVSDKFCNINPATDDNDLRVDRYMNFLRGDGTNYLNPETDITENCVDGSGDPPPMTFSESASSVTNSFIGTYSPVVPDAENYKFAHHGRKALNANWASSNDGYYYYSGEYKDQSKVFKKIDDAYYKRQLNIAHVSSIYGLNASTDTTRAPFECDPSANECYSGSCNIQVHNRGVNVQFPGIAEDGAEVVSDCNKIEDENGRTRIVCAPTISVAANGNNPPSLGFAKVELRPAHIETTGSGLGLVSWYPTSFNSLASDPSVFNPYWANFSTIFSTDHKGTYRNITNTLSYMTYYYTKRKFCSVDYPGENTSNTTSLCSSGYSESSDLPPVGGIVFFGQLKDQNTVVYKNNTIIGYAISNKHDFDDMLFVKNCGINMTGQASENVTETSDFVRVDLSGPDDPDWAELMQAFTPYFMDRMDAVATKGVTQCNSHISADDAVISSIPWVFGYEKGLNDPEISLGTLFDVNYSYGPYYFQSINKHLTSTPAQEYREKNVYEQAMAGMSGASACELSLDSIWWWGYWNNPKFYYNLAHTRYIYLFKYKPQSKKIGNCAVDDSKFLPEIKTFGWCEPCTTSTLAYQNLTARDRVYMPYQTAKVQGTSSINVKSLCSAQYNTQWTGFLNWEVTDNVTCIYDPVTDISEYKESIGYIGSPRTIPDATIIKERAGAYMKSGILPVFDLSDASNWDLTNPDSDEDDFCLFFLTDCDDADSYAQYDFERLFGNMGASVVIVDHVSSVSDANAKLDGIKERSASVRERCWGCLTAFHVDSPASNDTFDEIIGTVLDPQASFTIDMITFDYKISDHSISDLGPDAVVDDIESYSRIALKTEKKPTMLVGLSVKNNDGTYSFANHGALFDKIVERQNDLVKAGLVGIIYSPARGASGNDGLGIVNLDGSGLGTKNQKFCALQGAMYKMTTIPPNALFTKVVSLNNITCEPCTGLDKTQKNCGDPPEGPGLKCDNGEDCLLPDPMPSGMSATDFKCPESTVVDDCTLCKDVGGSYTCTKTFFNGTKQNFSGPMSEITSDIYLDVVAGLPKPIKCCLESGSGNESVRYSFTKKSFATPLNKPIVFPKSGDDNVDCGFGADTNTISTLSNFCNVQTVPIKDYDINCSIS